jgi:hypothetical protein
LAILSNLSHFTNVTWLKQTQPNIILQMEFSLHTCCSFCPELLKRYFSHIASVELFPSQSYSSIHPHLNVVMSREQWIDSSQILLNSYEVYSLSVSTTFEFFIHSNFQPNFWIYKKNQQLQISITKIKSSIHL